MPVDVLHAERRRWPACVPIRVAGVVAMLAPAALLAEPPAPMPAAPTAREIVERQLAAPPVRREPMSGAEASRIHDLYMGRIGKKLEQQPELPGSRAGS